MQSLCSRNLVKNQYSWQWQYYYLTDEGVEYAPPLVTSLPFGSPVRSIPTFYRYLRDYLHLPPEIVPATLKKASRPQADGFRGGGKDGKGDRGPPRAGDRDGYRGGGKGFGKGGDDKKPGARPHSASKICTDVCGMDVCTSILPNVLV